MRVIQGGRDEAAAVEPRERVAAHTVLCCVSDVAGIDHVLRAAARLTAAWGAELRIALLDPVPVLAAEADVAYAAGFDLDHEIATRKRLLRNAVDTAGVAGAELDLHFGDFDAAVEALVVAYEPDTVVLASGDVRRGKQRWLARPASSRAADLRVPLLVVPELRGARTTQRWGLPPIAAARPRSDSAGMSSDHQPPRSIVCGVDPSEDARIALRVAGKLSDALGLRLVVTHVAHLHPAQTVPVLGLATPMIPPPHAESHDVARRAVQEIVDDEGLDDAELRIEVGFPAEAIADLADRENAELVVVGSRGQGAFKAAFLGSVSNELIGVARCPVLVVPRGMTA